MKDDIKHLLPVLLLLLASLSQTADADSFKTLLMPGKVIAAHEKYEENCEQCHDTSSKARQGRLCMKCHEHENILDDISNKTGYHGRLPADSSLNCKHCHTEHKGRKHNIILFNPLTFNHDQTDFRLKGDHIKAQCSQCHKKDKKYAETPSRCISCHKKDDVHKGKQGKKCQNCHSPASWKKSAFDHDKTDFKLRGRHKKTACSACHINKQYKDTPKQCVSCHKIQDVHRNAYGAKCHTCHQPSKWIKARFNHDKTEFKLKGRHKKTSCQLCHAHGKPADKAPKQCVACHKADDAHKKQFGAKCQDCHSAAGWQKTTFRHNKATKFPLEGKHSSLSCVYCHRGTLGKEKLKTSCYSCHKAKDVHDGKQGKQCDNCHSSESWRSASFDHDLSAFPLIGMHAAAQCEECHEDTHYGKTRTACNACHAEDDTHETRLGTNCDACHNPNDWNIWLFDHDKQTRFTIDGAHSELGCYDCHQSRASGKLKASSDCISCHRNDDTHDRQFGRRCDRCHTTDSFSDITIQ